MKVKEITRALESWAPLSLQESYDNSGLLVGSYEQEVNQALISLDVSEEAVHEAIDNRCQMIISHHPVIFGSIKKLNGRSMVERIVMTAIKHDIALYAIHTNLDNISTGVNAEICRHIGIKNPEILDPKPGILKKLVCFVPDTLLENNQPAPERVLEALWASGAGHIGNYDRCSYKLEGSGTFRALDGAHPFIGKQDELAKQSENRIEVIFPAYLQGQIIKSLLEAHPYEEVAYDIYSLDNAMPLAGAGMIGDLESQLDETDFLHHLKTSMQTQCIRFSPLRNKKIQKVAVGGGSGSFLLKNAIAAGADALVTGDFKYHQFFDAEGKILIADIGHYESEQFTIGLIFDQLKEKFPNFALLKSRVNTNPVNYI